MGSRDNFSASTIRALALRAGHCCSFRGCSQRTIGPSDESSTATTNIGKAAHICAAASGPGARRFDPSMSAEQRRDISNGIWLCGIHADLIDRDSVTYSAEVLRQMRLEREAACRREVSGQTADPSVTFGLIAIGADIICTGDISGTNGSEWSIYVRNFFMGDLKALITFSERFAQAPAEERFLLINALGDGRGLTAPPAWVRRDSGYEIKCQVAPPFPRIRAQDLGSQTALSPDTGDFQFGRRVSGLDSFPQNIRTCLSMQRGESPFHPLFGGRIAEYFAEFNDSPWLGDLLKLEVIRLAAIPYRDTTLNREYTPLQAVSRVRDVSVLPPTERNRLPIRLDLEVEGIGRWTQEIVVLVPDRL